MAVSFFKDGSTQLQTPVNIANGKSKKVHLDLRGASQLSIHCVASADTNHTAVQMDAVLGNVTVGA